MTEMRRCWAMAPSLVLFVLALTLSVLVAFASAHAARAAIHSSGSFQRCGFASSPYGRPNVYIPKGSVSCRKGRRLIHRAFYTRGTFVIRNLSEKFSRCSPPTNAVDGAGYGNLVPLLVRRGHVGRSGVTGSP